MMTVTMFSLTSQEYSLPIAFSLVVTSPSYGPKCIPGDTVGPWLTTPRPALGMLDLAIIRPWGRERSALWGPPMMVGESRMKEGPLMALGSVRFWNMVRHSLQSVKVEWWEKYEYFFVLFFTNVEKLLIPHF